MKYGLLSDEENREADTGNDSEPVAFRLLWAPVSPWPRLNLLFGLDILNWCIRWQSGYDGNASDVCDEWWWWWWLLLYSVDDVKVMLMMQTMRRWCYLAVTYFYPYGFYFFNENLEMQWYTYLHLVSLLFEKQFVNKLMLLYVRSHPRSPAIRCLMWLLLVTRILWLSLFKLNLIISWLSLLLCMETTKG